MPVSKFFGYRHKYLYEAVRQSFRYTPVIISSNCFKDFSFSVPAVQNIFNNLLLAFSLFLLPGAEVVVFLGRGVVGVVKIIVAFVIAAVVIAVTVVTGKGEEADYGMRNRAGPGNPICKRCLKRKHMTIS